MAGVRSLVPSSGYLWNYARDDMVELFNSLRNTILTSNTFRDSMYYMYLATVTQKGQITIPVNFRRLLNLVPNDRVVFEKKGGKIVLSKGVDIMSLAGKMKPKKNMNVDPVKAREYMEKNYKRI
ncbi:hypothetical protein COT86_00210 [Candidatus Collierbacteria bacterium CG10_big_fil_rev_8_21_14_0_10_43_36]|uniref:SpoVT-AbrB domain-containing protein n=3 Tax=Candidatus Collieribacteriota TaxID=1752725 RepID=A0A2H0DUY8_9BACT|nr:MAG: hypothetical protein COW83_01930 [Candidatus Collierbacteria bacterium CG22_combo_CG10-13_8_21_14_all_43_12]PIS00134.1 MAG: hypothetical protein COT86_00210 [Candidatus Collierbacteria bacterium CG10_big_fil_rev_8_21_14_0_10_43_36]